MKKFFCLAIGFFMFNNCAIALEKCNYCNKENPQEISKSQDVIFASKVIKKLNKQTEKQIEEGYGPFLAAIYDNKGNLIATMPNTVVKEQCSLNHAEVNTIKEAQKKLGTYDLAPYDLSIYINAEPCIMCAGAIMWSGIKHVYYSVSSKDVESITGFDEGYKPDWIEQFQQRGISVTGNIDSEHGKNVLRKYVQDGKTIYKPSRS